MQIVETKFKRIREVTSSPDFKFFTTLTGNEGIAFWKTKSFLKKLEEKTKEGDLIC